MADAREPMSTPSKRWKILRHPVLRRIAGSAIRRISRSQKDEVVTFWMRWARTRVQAVGRLRRLVRGTAVVWPEPGRAWAVGHDSALPGREEVLIQTEVSVVSPGTERAYFARLPNAQAEFPVFPGYATAGRVVAVGRGVRTVRPGSPVAAAARHASLALAREDEVYPVPPGVALEEAAFVQFGVIALQGLRLAGVEAGQPLAVLGHGIIGQLTVQLAAAFGSYPVISIARTDRRLGEPLRRFAQRIIILAQDGLEVLDQVGAAATLDATGHPDGVSLAVRCTRAGGRVVLVGSTRGVTQEMDLGAMADRAVTVVGAHVSRVPLHQRQGTGATVAEDAGLFLRLLAEQRLEVTPLVSERIHPWEAEWFYRRLCGEQDATVAALFCWDRLPAEERLRRASYFTGPDLGYLQRAELTYRGLSVEGAP